MLGSSREQQEDIYLPVVETLHDYLHFLQEYPGAAVDSGALIQAMSVVHDELDRIHDPAFLLTRFLAEDSRPSAETRLQDLRATTVVSAVDSFLYWMGPSAPATQKGGLRRKDVEPVAAMLGIPAEGVNKRDDAVPPEVTEGALFSGEGLTIQQSTAKTKVLSMWELPELAAWWKALLEMEIIELGSTKVYPGPAADDWMSSHPLVALELREDFVTAFIGAALQEEAEPFQRDGFLAMLGQRSIPVIIGLLVDALHREDDPAAETAPPEMNLLAVRPRMLMAALARLGILQGGEDAHRVPASLRPAVVQAIFDARSRFLGYSEELPAAR
ncbi:hypothetical protein GCM10011359_15420 [Nesterenkonia alkaliphila]|nr:hypothetical protein GCM10011359_15420 [Nesterenkonia alkaliphila]